MYCLTYSSSLYRMDMKSYTLERIEIDMGNIAHVTDSDFYRTAVEKGYYLVQNDEVEMKNALPDVLISQHDQLMALSAYTGLLFRFDETMAATHVVALDFSDFMPTLEQGYLLSLAGAVPLDNTLYLAIEYYHEDKEMLCNGLFAFNMTTGAMETVYDQDVHAILPYKQGQLICQLTDGTLNVLDGSASTPLGENPVTERLCYNPYNDTLYTLSPLALTPISENSTPAYVPIADAANASIVMLSDTLALLSGNAMLYLRDITGAKQAQTLTIISYSVQANYKATGSDVNVMRGFNQLFPDIEITHMDSDFDNNIERFANSIVTQSDEIDIFELAVSETYMQGRKKGYFSSLSHIPGMQELYDSMYPVFQDVITDEAGNMIAYPASLSFSQIGYSRWATQQVGLTALPQTYDALISLLATWEENTQGIAPYARTTDIMRQHLIWFVLDTYILYCQKDYPAAQAMGEEVIALLDQINALPDSIDSVTALSGNPPTQRIINIKPEYLFSSRATTVPGRTAYSGLECIFNFSPLPLRLTKDAPIILPMTMTVYVINPYSKNIALAKKFLENYASLISPTLKCKLFQGRLGRRIAHVRGPS